MLVRRQTAVVGQSNQRQRAGSTSAVVAALVLLLASAALELLLASAAIAQQPAARPQTHMVKRGDTLWDLANTYLGDPFLWPEIYRLNTDQIEDPHWIYPGEVLKLPGYVEPATPAPPVTTPTPEPEPRDTATPPKPSVFLPPPPVVDTPAMIAAAAAAEAPPAIRI